MKFFDLIPARSFFLLRISIILMFILSSIMVSSVTADGGSPDLILTNVSLDPIDPNPGEPFTVNLTITNQGTADEFAVIRTDVYIDIDPMTILDSNGCPTEIGTYFRANDNYAYAMNESRSGTDTAVDIPGDALSVGIHNVWVYLDGNCLSAELAGDRANNVFGPITLSVGEKQVFTSIPSKDGWILESAETSGEGGTLNTTATTVQIGDDAANRQYRAILSFNTANLPDSAVITRVVFKFKYAGITGTLPFNTHGNLLVDIRRGPFSNNSILQLADFKTLPSQSGMLAYNKTKVSNWYLRSFKASSLKYVNKLGVTQFRLRFSKDDNNDFNADYLKIYSGNASTATRPKLIVEYYVP